MDLITSTDNSTELTSTLGLNATIIGAPLAAIASEVDPETCRLLGPVALGVQGLMGFLVLGSLVLKRAQEKPRRKWRVWAGDVSKQIVGQAFVHMSNVLISDQIARHKADNPCSLYALNIVVDCTLGIFVLYGFLKLSTHIMVRYQPAYRPGDYGDPFNISTWATQAAVYVACLTAMKLVVIAMFWIFPDLVRFASWLLHFIPDYDAQVVIAMLILPVLFNIIQFLVVDSIIKSKDSTTTSQSKDDEESRRGFLESDELFDQDGDDSDGEGDGQSRAKHNAQTVQEDLDSGYADSTLSKTPGTLSGQQTPTPRPVRNLSSVNAAGETTPTPSNGLAHGYPPRKSSALRSSPIPTSTSVPKPRGFGPVSRIVTQSDPVSFGAKLIPDDSEKVIVATADQPQRGSIDGAASNASTDEGWGVNDWDAGSMDSLDLARQVEELTNEKHLESGNDWSALESRQAT